MRGGFSSSDSGHSSLSVLTLIMLLAALYLMGSSLLRQNLKESQITEKEWQNRIQKEQILRQVMIRLEADPTPQSHSPVDPVWDYIASCQTSEISVELKDISSRLNPNFMETKLFEETRLQRLLVQGTAADFTGKNRGERKFYTNLADLTGTFGEENVNRFFTLHSWANINITAQESLEVLYRIRAGEGGAFSFLSRIQEGLREGKLWKTEELSQVLGTSAETLYPVINCLPAMNIHFMEPLVLESILSYPFEGLALENHSLLAATLMSRRERGEIDPSELQALINPAKEQLRILEYVGTKTWFWKVNVKIGEKVYPSVIGSYGELWFVVE